MYYKFIELIIKLSKLSSWSQEENIKAYTHLSDFLSKRSLYFFLKSLSCAKSLLQNKKIKSAVGSIQRMRK